MLISPQARPLLAKAISGESFDLLVDPRLEKNYDTTQMADMAACAASCIRQSAWLRPRMSQVCLSLFFLILNIIS